MKKTILLGEKGMISTKTSAWLLGILGLMWLVLGGIEIFKENATIGSSGYLLIGVVLILYSLIVFTVNPFAPKVNISDTEIKIKKKVFGGSHKILWANMKSIELDQYLIIFHLLDRSEEISYSTNAEISIDIKSTIREVAESKNIQVTGG